MPPASAPIMLLPRSFLIHRTPHRLRCPGSLLPQAFSPLLPSLSVSASYHCHELFHIPCLHPSPSPLRAGTVFFLNCISRMQLGLDMWSCSAPDGVLLPPLCTLSDINRLPSWQRGHLCVASSTDASSTVSSEGEFKDTDRCCWKHQQCTGHILRPFTSDCGHHNLHLHSVSHCDCDSRVKECLEKTNSSGSRDVGPTCSRDVGSACFNIIQTPCFELIPEEEYVERFWYGWCKSYRPLSVAVIHHPIHHKCGADDLNEEEEEEEEEEASKPPIPTQVGPTTPTDAGIGTGPVMATPDSAAPITIWRSESPTGKSQGSKVLKKVKKKKEKEKDKEEDTDEKTKLKKKVKKGKLTKKKSPIKSDSSPPDLSRSISPRELARMSESSPDSREDLESEDSYNDPRPEELSSEDIVESSSPRKRENTGPAKKPGPKASPVKVNKRKSPPASNPNLS